MFICACVWLIIYVCILFGISGFWFKKGILVDFGHLVNKGNLVILLEGYFGVLMKIVIFTKLLVNWGNYLETIIIRYFDSLSE